MVTKNPRITQPDLGIGHGTARQFEPVPFVQEGARRYAESRGQTYDPSGLDQVQVDPQRGHAQYREYERSMQRDPDPSTAASYGHMREELHAQHDFMTRPEHEGGMGIKMEVTDHDPYPSPQAMADDLRTNRRIKVLSTESTGGHAFFSNEENDKFRAVHDVFGHAGIGRGFSRHGEEAAYLSHAQMFSPEARTAMASETRGQNSYLNFSGTGQFPDQGSRLVGMPQWATERGPLPEPKTPKIRPQGVQGRLF